MSNPKQEFRAYVEDSSLKFNDEHEEKRFKMYLGSIKPKDEKRANVRLIVKKVRDKRTSGQAHEKSNQNGYYWGPMITTLISSDPFIGMSAQDMDYGLRCMFLRVGGSDAFPKTKSFSELNAGEFEEKMKEIQIWALAEYRIRIETVEEYYFGSEL